MAKCDINNKQRLFDVLKSKDIVDMANDNNIEYRATLSGNILNISVKSGVDNAYIVQSLIENAVNNSFPGILLSSRTEDGYINTILFTERVNNTIKDKRNKRIAKLRFDRSIVRNDGEVISPSGYPAIPMANDRNGIIKNLERQIHQEATNAWDLGEVADVSNRGVGKLINEYYKSDVVSYYDEGTDLTFARVQVPEFLVDIYYNELSNIIKERREKWSSDLMEQSSFWDENGDVDQYNSISTTNTEDDIWNDNSGLDKQRIDAQYSQYLDSLNKPNTNPILQGNQQEQVKKFTELQERLNNKEFLEGAKNAFENSEELQNIYYEAAGFETELPSYDNIIETDNKKDKKEKLEQRRELVLREINAIEQLIKTNPDEITIYHSKPYKDAYEVIKYFDKNNWEKDDSKYKESKIITKPSYLHNHLEEELQKRIKNLQIINSSLFSDVEKVNYSNIFKEGKSYSSVEVLKYVSDNKKDVLSGIAKTLIKYAEKNNVEIQIVEKAPKTPSGAYFYSNKIEIYGNKNVTSHTLIHEIIHSFSSDYIRNNPKSLPVLQLENILKNILDKKILKEYSNFEGSYEDYATKNIHELLAEIISRPDILAHLALYDTNYNLITGAYKKETLLDKIIKILSNIFNFSKNEIETLSDLILFNTRDIFEASTLWSEFNRNKITPQQKQDALNAYTDYIARVSLGIIKNPSSGEYNYTSKVKDIVYHGTLPENKFEKFDKQRGTNLSGEFGGIHFGDLTAAKERPTKVAQAENFLLGIEEDLANFKPNIISVILNISNIKRVEEGRNWGQGDWSKLISKEKEADGFVYTNKIENKGKDSYVVFEPEQIHILSSKADIQGFKDFVQGKQTFDKELAQKIQDKLQKLYPEIKLNITNNPVWEQGDNVFNQEEYSNQVIYGLKATKTILDNLTKIKQWESNKSIDKNTLWRKIGELGISKQQLDLLKESDGNTIEEKFTSFVTNYSYTVEINTAKEKTENIKQINATYFEVDGVDYTEAFGSWFKNEGTIKISYNEYKNALDKYNAQNIEEAPTQYYSNLTVPGGTNYTENEIRIPDIIPSIKGHAQFSTENGIGWFRSDDKENKIVGWKEEDDFLNSETAQYNPITKNDKIIFGHPTIGKSYLKQKGNNDFISLDDDYANEVIAFIDTNRSSETRQEYKGRKPKEYNEFMLNLFDRLKLQAKKEGKRLFVSNTNILKERMSDFDKVITIPKDEFKKRFDARGATYGFEDWKSDIDDTVAKVDKSKVISTRGYLSDLLEGNPKTRRILEVQSEIFQKGRNLGNVEAIIEQLKKSGELKVEC